MSGAGTDTAGLGEGPEPLSAAWCAEHFDHMHPLVGRNLQDTLATLRAGGGLTHSDQHGGFWVATGYEEVLAIAQDWESFSSEHGITVPSGQTSVPAIPEQLDPPRHREFKRLINAHFTPAVVLEREADTRALVTELIDEVIEAGECDFMAAVAKPLPSRVFVEMVLHAPASETAEITRLANVASTPTTQEGREARGAMLRWINDFVDRRRGREPLGDVVDAVIGAEIEGRPIEQTEIVGVLQLLLFGGLDTTAGALGQMMVRFCREPELVAALREHPDRLNDAVEELLRLDSSFIFIGRTAMRDVEVAGKQIKEGDRVLISWASANRDEGEFACPFDFDLERESNRHIAFGAGPHRCAGSNLARMNLRIAVREIVERFEDLRLADDDVRFHSSYSRAPVAVPITYRPGPRLGARA